jgi:hypothetical protein
MYPFMRLFPEIGNAETRTVTLFPDEEGQTDFDVPPGEYGFVELYCEELNCDCRRVMLNVLGRYQQRHLATINHSFEPPGPGDLMDEQTFLDPINPQSQWADGLLRLFNEVVLTPEYSARLERHYRMVKDALKDPDHPIHGRIPPEPGYEPRRASPADLLVPRRRGNKRLGRKKRC